MTLEEMAEEGYKSHVGKMGYHDGTQHKLYFDGFKDGYRVARNGTWHDLLKNPTDLPKEEAMEYEYHCECKLDGSITLNDAILHLEDVLKNGTWKNCEQCKREHEQLHDWLVELRNYRGSGDGY